MNPPPKDKNENAPPPSSASLLWLVLPFLVLCYAFSNYDEKQLMGLVRVLIGGGVVYSFLIMTGGYAFGRSLLRVVLKSASLASLAVFLIVLPSFEGDFIGIMTNIIAFLIAVVFGVYAFICFFNQITAERPKQTATDKGEQPTKEQVYHGRARVVATIAFFMLAPAFYFLMHLSL